MKLASLFAFYMTEVTNLGCFLYVSRLKSLRLDTHLWNNSSRFVTAPLPLFVFQSVLSFFDIINVSSAKRSTDSIIDRAIFSVWITPPW